MNYSKELANYTNSTTDPCQLDASFFSNEFDSEYEQIVNGKPGYILWGIVFVLLTIIGNIGNVITIIILKRDPIISTLTILLIGLAVSDILAPQANAILAFTHFHLAHRYANSITFLKFNNFIRVFVQPLGSVFTMSSSWIITLTTLFRLIAVMCPFKARTLINKRLAICSLIAIFLLSLLSILPLYTLLVTTVRCTIDRKQAYSGYDINIKSDLLKAYIPVLQVLCFYLPWLTSLLLWFFLIRSLRNAERNFNTPKESLYSGASLSMSAYTSIRHHSKRTGSTLKKHQNNKNGSICSNNINLKNNSTKPVQQLVGLHDDYGASRRISVNFVQNRNRSYNRITLMIVVLCFINLICQLFTFVFIFELVYNKIIFASYLEYMSKVDDELLMQNSTTNATTISEPEFLDAKSRFPKFLSYSLLLNNIFLGVNHSCNLFIYIFTNPRFKHNFVSLVKRFKYFLCKTISIDQKKKVYMFKKVNNDDKVATGRNSYSIKPLFEHNFNSKRQVKKNINRTLEENVGGLKKN